MKVASYIVGLLVATSLSAWAERSPPRPQPLSASAGPARVIVQFKYGSSTLRAQALSAGDSTQAHERALGARAVALGTRHGLALRSGAAVGEREQVVHGPAGMTSQALAEQLSRDADVAWAEPDRRLRRTLLPNDSLFASGGAQGPAVGQWYLRAPAGEAVSSINAAAAWDTTTGSANVIVAVLDTGVVATHPDLAGKLIGGYDFVSNETGEPAISNDGDGRDADPGDPGDWLTQAEINADPTFWGECAASSSSWHGTQVAGIVGAATGNSAGMAGSGWNVRVMPVRVLGKCFGYTSDILAAMKWAAGITVPGVPANPNPAKVINLSLGSSASACSAAQQSAIAEINARGAVVVVAAGNSAGRAASSPANCPGAIGVAAVRHVGSKVGFSDVGPQLAIAAPGGNCVNVGANEPCLYPILTTLDSGARGPAAATYSDSFNISVGTSFAAPLVSGTAALMLSANATLQPAALKAALQSSARPFPSSGLTDDSSGQPVPLQACNAPGDVDQLQCYCTTATCGAGLLDAGAAVAAALGTPTPTPTPTPEPTPPTTGGGDSGGGGGGMSALWLLALASAVLLLLRPRPTRALGVLTVASAAALLAAAPPPALAAQQAATVNGLIVQLRDAPSHAALGRARALATSDGAHAQTHEREQARWQSVMSALPPLRVTERRAVGESAQLMRFEQPMTAAQAQAMADQLAQRPEVLWAAPNTRERRLQAAGPANAPTDPLFGGVGGQWWLQPAAGSDGLPTGQRLRGVPGFQTAWASVTTGSGASVIAVLDNGIVAHPDLDGKVIAGYDMVGDVEFSNDGDGRDANPSDPGDWVDSTDLARPAYEGCVAETSSWHGTAIAGMLVANVNNSEGGASMNWPGRVLAVRVAAKCGADVVDIVDGMRWAAGRTDVCRRSDSAGQCLEFVPANPNPARIVNISFGGTGTCEAYQSTIDELRALGVVVVAAAGNEHAAEPTRPAKCPGVIGVGALNRDGFKSTYSNFGAGLVVSTVGGDDADGAWGGLVADSGLFSVGNFGDTGPAEPGYFSYFGTSFSTPIVVGAVSLMLAVNPALTAAQIEQGLRASARPHVTSSLPGVAACSNANPGRCLCTAETCGAGILDVPRALAYAAAPGSFVPTALQAAAINATELRDAAAAGPDRPANASSGNGNGGDSGGGGGGGAMSAWWLAALGAAVLALRRRPSLS